MSNDNLHKALKNKNDEFYTCLTDIQKELQHYKSFLKGKKIYLNCDDLTSNFWKFFIKEFDNFELCSIISTSLEGIKRTYNGSIITEESLKGDGSFYSDECIEIMKTQDVVITNPPFSLFRKLIVLLTDLNKDFIIIGNENTLSSIEVFPLFKDKKIFLGYNSVKEFYRPDGTTQTFGNIKWFTSFNINKEYPKINFVKSYNEKEYPTYDNYEAINVDKVKDIPKDYQGIMGVPVSFLAKCNPAEFNILGIATGSSNKHNLNFTVPHISNPLEKGGCCVLQGKRKYTRVFIQRI